MTPGARPGSVPVKPRIPPIPAAARRISHGLDLNADPVPDEKNEAPPSTIVAVAQGLSIAAGPPWHERFLPGVFAVLYLVGLILPAFVKVPNEVAYYQAMAVVGPIGLSVITRLGLTPPRKT